MKNSTPCQPGIHCWDVSEGSKGWGVIVANSHQHNEVAKWANGARVHQPRYFWFRFWQIHMQSHPTDSTQLALPTFMKPESVQIIDTGMNRRTELFSQEVKTLLPCMEKENWERQKAETEKSNVRETPILTKANSYTLTMNKSGL